MRASALTPLLLVIALFLVGCAFDRQISPPNPGGLAPAPPAATLTPRPPGSTAAPAPSATPMDDDTVTIDLGTAPPNQQPLPPGQTRIYGRVTGPQGAPIHGAAVTIPRGTSPVPERAALTDENGNYNWVLPPGIYTVQVNADGFQPAQAQADTQQQAEFELNFSLKPE